MLEVQVEVEVEVAVEVEVEMNRNKRCRLKIIFVVFEMILEALSFSKTFEVEENKRN